MSENELLLLWSGSMPVALKIVTELVLFGISFEFSLSETKAECIYDISVHPRHYKAALEIRNSVLVNL